MGLSLLLPLLLLLLLTTLQAGNSARCDPKMDFRMDQPEHLSAPKGGTVHINFTFYYCGALAKDPRVSIALRRTHFHGEVIYNSTRHFVHEDYKDRIILNLPEGQKSGFLQILNLREEDENMYFCRVQLKTQRFGLQSVQSILGTKLTIYLAPKTTTKGPTSTVTTTTGLSVLEGNRTSVSLPLSVEAVVKVALTIAVLKTVILGLTLYLRWKTSKGDPSKILRRSMRTLGFKAKLQSGSQLLITTLARHRRLRSQGVWKATKDCRETEPSAPVPSPPSQPCPQE
ncbi:paired immunoglobulin-like type 2 receptor beta isoform X1 [Canis lupus baileyi]|uniref:paired immunoglobulin-like type 2 receptor beta isoform X1 n=1 Tax=Canis lupus dingo TaxID=286419 RepID=UPI0015F17CDE|nr:paired immunoglobulin-like type 2 receptor beta isoform X1 [Canis lupus dingo]XP_038395256.1 paired immunoglobulin-like type 2 receptor beta isoform X17 [Canis lupus familiaris]